MSDKMFKALVVEEKDNDVFQRSIKEKSINELPAGEVLIRVEYSALNYKDALSAKGHKGITRNYPHTPGIDAAGIVEVSSSPLFTTGEKVFVTGYDLGMNTDGGFGQYIRVPAGWIVKIPKDFSSREIMIYGTAGFTAGYAMYEILRNEITSDKGKILVTGATGGVGSLAVAMLSKAGYYVVASTGKPEKKEYLLKLGAKEILSRANLDDKSSKPLLQKKWAAAIDNVGGNALATIIRSMEHGGVVASIGLVQSDKFESTVYPFILRGVRLIGVDSAESPMDYRLKIWNKIFNEWRLENTDFFVKECNLQNLNNEIEKTLKGEQAGKVLVNLNN